MRIANKAVAVLEECLDLYENPNTSGGGGEGSSSSRRR
jgi:hypothetical protein